MNAMLAQTKSLPELLRSEFERLDNNVRTAFDEEELSNVERIFITGCGDSFYAGIAAKLALKMWTGHSVEVASSLSAGRYDFPYVPNVNKDNALFFGISVSGGVSRTIEAIQIASEIGGKTVAITGNEQSPLAQASDRIINCAIPDFPPSPGIRTYQISMLVLYLVGIQIATVQGKLSAKEAESLKAELLSAADVIEETIEKTESQIYQLAETLKSKKTFHFVSHGPNLGTAYFSAAKLVESAGCYATGQDTEEWAHIEHYNDVIADVPTFVISPGYRTHGLAAEFAVHMKRLQRYIVAVTPEADDKIAPLANLHLPVVGKVREELSPFVYMLAGELFSAHFADVTGQAYFRDGVDRYANVGDHRKTSIAALKDL